jgi:hypothetical protein
LKKLETKRLAALQLCVNPGGSRLLDLDQAYPAPTGRQCGSYEAERSLVYTFTCVAVRRIGRVVVCDLYLNAEPSFIPSPALIE